MLDILTMNVGLSIFALMLKSILTFILIYILVSCGGLKYKYTVNEKMEVVSLKKNYIRAVYIENADRKIIAQFAALPNKFSRTFDLKSHNPELFSCDDGCDFKFVPEQNYYIVVFPYQENKLKPLHVTVLGDTSILILK